MSQLKKNTLYNIVLICSQFVLPFISFPYLTHVLGPEKIGVVNFIDSITMTIVNISALGIPIYGVREIARARGDKDEMKKIFSELLILHLSFSLLTGLAYFMAIQFVPQLTAYKTLCYTSLFIIFLNIFLIEWYYKGLEKFKYITIRSIINRIIPIVLTFIFVRQAADYGKYYFIIAIATLLNVILNFAQLLFSKTVQLHSLSMRRHIKPLIYMLSSSIAVSVYIYLNSTFLGFMATPEHTGYYTSAIKITNISLGLITAMGAVIVPQLSKAFKANDFQKIQDLTDKSFKYVILLGLPVTIILFLFSTQIITILAGTAFLPASMTIKILSLNILIIGFNNIFGMQILTTVNYEKYFFKAVGIGMIASVILNLTFIPFFKHNGAAISSVVTELIVTLITYYYVIKKVKLHFQWSYLLQNMFACVASYLVAYMMISFLDIYPVLKIGLTACFGSLFYFLALVFYLKDDFVRRITEGVILRYGLTLKRGV